MPVNQMYGKGYDKTDTTKAGCKRQAKMSAKSRSGDNPGQVKTRKMRKMVDDEY